MPPRISVAVLGATGTVGQRFILRLAGHPWFEVTRLFASARSAGQSYQRAARWLQPVDMPEAVRELAVEEATPDALAGLAASGCALAFSALGAEEARTLEPAAAGGGAAVFSNASAFRMHPGVPLLVPEVNAEHLALAQTQDWPGQGNGSGALYTNPNCSATGLVMALAPLARRFGLRKVHIVTLQALSGAGLVAGQPLSVGDNVVPNIPGEAGKLCTEPLKLLGHLITTGEPSIAPADFQISATTVRVPVTHGHTLCVSIELEQPGTAAEINAAWHEARGRPQDLALPSAPAQPIHVLDDAPQPLLHRDLEGGMAISVGHLERDPLFDASARRTETAPVTSRGVSDRACGWKFVTLSHNLERGAAGGSVLNAELVVATQS